MGNLARPGYTATTEGMWPYRYFSFPCQNKHRLYLVHLSPSFSIKRRIFQVLTVLNFSYDSCDVGTFPNQTDADGLGPPAALFSDASRAVYNFSLSWLPGQRTS